MKSKKAARTILTIGIAALVLALTLMVVGIVKFLESVKPIAVVTSPGTTTVQLEKPGSYLLWEDTNLSSGSTSRSSPTGVGASTGTPSTFTHTLTHTATGNPAPFMVSSMTMNRSYGSTQSRGIGGFEVTSPGLYEFSAQHPANIAAQFSLTSGSFAKSLAQTAVFSGLAVLLGLAGLAGTIVGIVLLVGQKKTPSAPPLPNVPS